MIDMDGIAGKATATPSFLELHLLGAPQVLLNAQPLHHTLTGKPLALLLYLAVTGQPHTRDVLALLLWSELSIQQARNNLRYVLPMLRRAVAPYLSVTTQTISFDRQVPYWQDVEVLRTTLQGNLAAISTEQLQSTLDLYQGEFLAGFRVRNAPSFVAWLTAQRQQLQTLALQGLLHLAERQLLHQDYKASQITRQRIMGLIPNPGSDLSVVLLQSGIDLAPYQHLMPWLKAGELRQSTAEPGQLDSTSYGNTNGQLREIVIATESARLTVNPATSHDDGLPSHANQAERGHNLPSQLTPFFGRQEEMAEIKAYLSNTAYRLLTLTGEGGIGKTRLALAVAQSIIDLPLTTAEGIEEERTRLPTKQAPFPDGIWFVPLAHVSATGDLANQVATAIAKALQLALTDQDTPTAQIIHYFAGKQSLLLLDNFEHLQAGTGFILDLLQGSTTLKVLITSRHRLNVQAEYPWRLVGLPLPPLIPSVPLSLAVQHEYAGVALFVERARRAYPGFQLKTDHLTAVVQICHFVQGLPLGIELAAALTKEYTCTEVWEILSHNYHILATTLPDFPARHRNIKVLLDHSWRFLSDEEARVLARCAVFCGPFEREAAIAITEASPEIITRLIDQSLLQWTTEAAGRRWLHLHELVRQYAVEQLAAIPKQRRQVQERHAAYYMRQLHEAERALAHNGPLFQQMRSNLPNLRAAWLWSCETQAWHLLEQGLWGMTYVYRLAGLFHDAVQALQVAIAAIRPVLSSLQQRCLFPRLLNNTVEFCRYLGRLEEGERLAQEALDWAHRLGSIICQGRAYHELARLAQRRGQHLLMRTLAERATTLTQTTALPRLAAKCLTTLGAAEFFCGNLRQSIQHYERALRYLHEAPDFELEAAILINLGIDHLRCHNYAMARHYLTQALTTNQSAHTLQKNGAIYVLSGQLWATLGAYAQARQDYLQALAIFKEVYEPYWESWVHMAMAHLSKQSGQTTDALVECERVLTLVQGRIPIIEHCTLTYLGDIHMAQRDWVAGEQFYRQALTLQQQAQLHFRLTEPAIQLANLLLQRDEAPLALAQVEEPLTRLTNQGLSALSEPFAAYWIIYQVLKANADVRANSLLQEANQHLLALATQIDDSALRRSFLEAIDVNRRLIETGRAAGIG